MASPRDLRRSLRPARGLLHPAWLASLALLALNDHVLKGSGVLPGAVTGKLSDFAGLFVAPILLALVARVRTVASLAVAHVAVGLVFCAIQLSAPLADAWSALMGLVGFPWVITRDPTDLVALPALVASFVVLRPALDVPSARLARRSAETAAAGVGLLACVATSSPDREQQEEPEPLPDTGDAGWDEPEAPWLPDVQADVYLHNGLAQDLVVRIRALAPEVDVDCDTVAADPGALLTSPLFGLASTWTLPPSTNQPVLQVFDVRDCHAALVEIDGLPPRILFWWDGQPPRRAVPAQGRTPEDPGEVAVIADPDGGLQWWGGDVSYDVQPRAAECAPQLDGGRLAWSEPVPWGRARITDLVMGPDGCWALHLQPAEELPATQWFLCIPEPTMVLRVGDEIEIALPEADAAVAGSFDAVAIDVIDPSSPAERGLVASMGGGAPRIADVELALVPDYGCDPEVQPACGTVARPAHVSATAPGLGSVSLTADGTPAALEGTGVRVELALMHAEERFALDPACALGPDTLGTDLEIVIARHPMP